MTVHIVERTDPPTTRYREGYLGIFDGERELMWVKVVSDTETRVAALSGNAPHRHLVPLPMLPAFTERFVDMWERLERGE